MKLHKVILTAAALGAILAGCISPELRTARIAVNERDWDRANTAIEAEIARTGPAAEPYYLRGLICEQNSDWAGMSAWYDSSLALSDAFRNQIEESRNRLFRVFLANSKHAADSLNWDKAISNIDIAITVSPKESILYQVAAVTAFNAGMYEKAIGYALGSIDLEDSTSGQDVPMREVLVASYSNLKDTENTLSWGKKLLAICDPDSDGATYFRTHDILLAIYEERGDNEAAIKLIDEALPYSSDRSVMLMNKALFLIRQKDFASASKVYQDVIAADPNNFDALLNYGTILATDKKWTEAIPILVKAHDLNPTNTFVIKNLMAAYYNTDQDKLGGAMRDKLSALEGGK